MLLLLLFAVVFVAIRIPSVQTKAARKAAAYLSDKLGHEVTIGRVDIEFFSNLVLEQVRVLDFRNEELFYVGRLEAEIGAFSIFQPNALRIATLELQQPRANLVVYEGTDSLNLSAFLGALNDLFVKKDTTKPAAAPFQFELEELVLHNGRFTYDNFNTPHTENGLDYAHLTLDSLSGRFGDIVLEDTLKVSIAGLSATETRSNTRLHRLDTRMTYAPTFWEWDALHLRLNNSHLQKYLRFDYGAFGHFTHFIDSVTVTANLEDSRIYSQDIAVFAPPLSKYDENILINSAALKGRVSNFTANNLDIKYGEHTHVVGSISADGLPNFRETFATLRLQPSTLHADDLKQFLPRNVYTVAVRLGAVNLEGRFLGFYNDFVANGAFTTALGKLESDINLKIDDDTRSSSYRGYINTNGFHLGRLVGNTDLVKTISMNGRIEGSGFTLQDADLAIDATIRQIQLLGYNYRNIRADGALRRQTFAGQVSVNDPNLVFSAEGEVNLAQGRQAFNMAANLERIDLQALRLTQQPVVLRAQADLDFQGLKLDEFTGTARFDSAFVSYNGHLLALDSVSIESILAEGERSLHLNSDLLALEMNGNFNYSTLLEDLRRLAEEYKLNFESSETATAAYYRRKPVNLRDAYRLSYDLHLKRPNPVLEMFVPGLAISNFTQVEGAFRHENTVILELYAAIDTIRYNDFNLYGNNIELNTSKLQQSPDVLAAALFTSGRQELPSAVQTENFFVEGIWSGRTIEFATSVRQPEQNNLALITGDLNFLEDQLQIAFDQSNITLQQNPWTFDPGNTVYISDNGRHIVFENFSLSNGEQVLQVAGAASEDPESKLVVNVDNFDLRNLNPLIAMDIAGTFDAEVTAQDIYSSAILNGVLQVDSFQMDGIYVGNISGRTDWSTSQKQAVVDIGIERNNKKVLALTGNYNPQAAEDQLDLLAVMDEANLKLAEPVLRPIMSGLEGAMEGRIRVLGRLDYPILTGSVVVSNGQFTFDYLNTTYTFSDRIYFGANSISFRNAQLRDSYGNTATVTGGIAHDGFQNMVIDLEARYRRFMVLNTTEQQNELFYGTAFATGTASVLGPVNNLRINVDARSEDNTRIVLPLDYQTDLARKDFIKFVNNSPDTTEVAVAVEEQQVDLSGINLNFNLDVTDDAYFEIIIDRTTGDVIRGSGNGDIRMTIDTRGDFNMFGGFEITEGAYNLNLLEGLVTREFRITPGGTITWNGDPVAGVMDITATYTQMTSLDNFVGSSELLTNLQGRRYPVTAVIELEGPLLTPEIGLGLRADELPTDIQGFFEAISNDETELNRQVFSLLVLRTLSPRGNIIFDGGVGAAAVGGSLGGILSGQLSSFFNSIDSNLEVDIGLDGISQDALSALQVRLSYTFFEGRLRVSGETGLGGDYTTYGESAAGRNNASGGFQGNWIIDYYLDRSGELRVRLEYNTIPRGVTRGMTGGVTRSQSISLLHTKRFDSLRELFGRDRPTRRQRAREEARERIILDSDPRLEL